MKNHDKRQQEKLWMKLFRSSVQRGEQHRNLHCRALFQDMSAKTKQPWALVIFIQLERRLCRPEFREIFRPRTFVSPRAHRVLSQYKKESQKINCGFRAFDLPWV